MKSDTDGFDGYIIADLAKEIKVSSRLVELISFEGPGEKQIPSGDYEEYLSAMNYLMSMGYKILILTNIGFPVANVGNDFEQIVWHMNNLQLQHCAGRAMCHYFDFIAVSPKLSTEVFNFDGKTRNRIFDELYGSQ